MPDISTLESLARLALAAALGGAIGLERELRDHEAGLRTHMLVALAERSRPPHLDVPSRSLSNVRFNKSRRVIEMGSGTNRRELFNLSQARSYMQTLLVTSGCKQLIEQGKTTSLRGMYYLLKHSLQGTKEETFNDQSESDPIIEDVEVMMTALERGRIRISRAHDPDNAGDARHLAARVIEKRLVTDFHLVSQEVARLVIAHAVPRGALSRRTRQVVHAER